MTEKQVKTKEDILRILEMVSFAPSCVNLDWKWETQEVEAVAHPKGTWDYPKKPELMGWLIRTSFVRPDTKTGEVSRGFGRWEFVPFGTTESGVVKTVWLLAELIVRHELMEAFHYRGVKIFDPHHTVEELSMPYRK